MKFLTVRTFTVNASESIFHHCEGTVKCSEKPKRYLEDNYAQWPWRLPMASFYDLWPNYAHFNHHCIWSAISTINYAYINDCSIHLYIWYSNLMRGYDTYIRIIFVALGFFAVGLFEVGQFAVKKKPNRT